MANLIIVSNRLPMSVKKENGKLVFGQSMGGLATGLSDYTNRPGTKWIGWPGIPTEDLTRAEQVKIRRYLQKYRCYPLFLSKKQIDDYYNGYSNGTLWPLFHNLPMEPSRPRLWQAYQEVNALFAAEVLRSSSPGSTIWVHDYQLMLVPQLLRRAGRNDRIGYFLHIPMPTPETLQELPEAKPLLRGILGADLIGFHTRGYTEAFLTACDELLGLENQKGRILLGERTIRATEFPMGIDYGRFAAATKQRGNYRALWALRRKYRGLKVIVTVDRLDPSKGLVERLRAYQELLRQHPELHTKVVMPMIVAPSRTDVPAYKALQENLDRILDEIRDEFATNNWQPVDFIYHTVPLDEVMLYYRIADVAFIAPIRDGMNLVAKEFIASKRNNGVLVLSRTAGAAEELQDAVLVDPADVQSMVDGLLQALSMSKPELQARARSMKRHIQRFTVQKWADTFMDVLQRPQTRSLRLTYTLSPRLRSQLIRTYTHADRRLLLLDYDGVLRQFVRNPDDAVPSAELLDLLRRLSSDARNDIVIISGRSKTQLADWFGELPIALAAEHGSVFRRKGGKNWHHLIGQSKAWKIVVRHLFDAYAELTPGVQVEEKDWSMVWHYRGASPYHTQKNLVALRRLLRPILKEYGLAIEEGNKVFEVRPSSANKGRVAGEWLIHEYDFVLAIGDDSTDEATFATLPSGAYSIKVGPGRTLANYRLRDVPSVLRLLGRL
jgi:trehalose 6-phosphate synthase/phosphatase